MTAGETRPSTRGSQVLERFLSADPRDPGCDKTTELLHAYAELAATDSSAAAWRHPHAAGHLRDRGACAEDLKGLLAAITAVSPGRL